MTNQIPVPPVEMVMPSATDNMIAVANFIVVAIVFIWMLREAKRTRTLLPLLCLLGAAISSYQEPIYDFVGAIWYPQIGQKAFWKAFNVSISLWLIPAFAWYIGGLGYFMYKKMNAGITPRQLWFFYVLFWCANIALELPGLNLHIYQYYGEQPFRFFGFPLWMAMTNSIMPILLGAVYNALRDVLVGPRVLFAVPIVPMVTGAAQIMAGWPTWLALNSGKGPVANHIAALVSLGLSLTVVYLVSTKLSVLSGKKVVS